VGLNPILEKALIKAILKSGRILIYADELEERYKEDKTYTFISYGNNNDSNVLTHPDILRQLNKKELNLLRQIYFIDYEIGIEGLSKIVTEYLERKMGSCTKKGYNTWGLIFEKTRKYFRIQEDYSEYNPFNYSGKIDYIIIDDDTDMKLAVISLNIDYCNYCYGSGKPIGIQKCVKYKLESN